MWKNQQKTQSNKKALKICEFQVARKIRVLHPCYNLKNNIVSLIFFLSMLKKNSKMYLFTLEVR